MIELYSGPLSLFTAKVRIALALKHVEHERIDVPFSRDEGYEPKHPIVVRHNPKQQVPVLVDGDLVLWDSTVIVEYLDEKFPEPRLLPKDPAGRAECRMRELHADEVFFPNVLTLIREVFYGGGDEETMAHARAELARHYRALDARLESREWIGGDDLNAADVTYRLATLFATTLGAAPPEELDRFATWMARIDAQPAVAEELAGLARAVAEISR